MTAACQRRPVRSLVVHSLRVGLFAAVVVLIHLEHARRARESDPGPWTDVEMRRVQAVFPTAQQVASSAAHHGGREVLDSAGRSLGFLLQTSPQGDHIIGFSGPTNVLIAFGADERIRGLEILSSGDTRDHVRQVRQDPRFLNSFQGLSWDEAARRTRADAVSGATLTSLAIQEAVIHRLGGVRPSLRFPDPLTPNEVRSLFPTVVSVEPDATLTALWHVKGPREVELGTVLRTSPAADSIIGYQGPTDALIAFDNDDRVVGTAVGRSYDNEPYVSYVRDDAYFVNLFKGLRLQELARFDIRAAEVEGVSGATMTSMAVAQGQVRAAAEHAAALNRPSESRGQRVSLTARDLGTVGVVVAGVWLAFSPIRGQRVLRLGFQALLIGYLGLVNGDLLSQAMLVGWAQHGIPWRSAAGMVFLSAAALLLPIATRRNVYCEHLCPHGAVQQLLKNRLPWRGSLPSRVARFLAWTPAVLLAWCVTVTMTGSAFSLVDIEPFDAWVFRVAGGATIVIALGGLVASLFVPMAYCRFGCPTGAMLNYLRLHSRSDQWTRRDIAAIALLLLALILRA